MTEGYYSEDPNAKQNLNGDIGVGQPLNADYSAD